MKERVGDLGEEVLASGFITVDIISAGLDKIPEPGELVFAPLGVRIRLGGHPGNVSVDLVQMGLEAGVVGAAAAVGKDPMRDFVKKVLESKGVTAFLQEVDDAETGKTVILVVKNEDRRYINEPGANLHLSYDFVLNALKRVKPRIFYIASGLLGDFDYRVWELLRECKENGILTVVDLVRPFGKEWDFIHPALQYSDVLHCNVSELEGITGGLALEDGIKWLVKRGVKLPVISDGERGLTAYFSERIIRQPSFKVNVVDPTGAGDALCAGIVYKLLMSARSGKRLEDLSLEEVVDMLLYGQASGAACVEEIGTTPGVTAKRIREILEEQSEKVMSQMRIEEMKD